jgi:hypothetical protein
MLLPENPEKRLELWASLSNQLAQDAMCFIIEAGIGNPLAATKALGKSMAELTVSRLRAAQICRISANRGNAVSPHFAGRREGDTVLITDFITHSSADMPTANIEKLRNDLETAVVNLFFAERGINIVKVPLSLMPWVMRDAKISSLSEGLIFQKIN